MGFLIIVLGIFAALYLFIRWKLQYWKRRNVPYVEPEFLFGNARGIGRKFNSGELFQKIYTKLKQFGPIGGAYLFTEPIVVAINLDCIKNIMIKDFEYFINRGMCYNEKDDPISAHLINIEDDAWRELRHKISPVFTSGKLKIMFDTISSVTDRLIETIRKETAASGQLEVKDITSRYTTDVIGTTAFGIDTNSLADKNNEFYLMGLKTLAAFNFIIRAFLTIFQDLSRKLHLTATPREIPDFYMGVVKSTIKYRKDNPNEQRNDFMSLLIKLMDAGSLTVNQIAAQSTVFILAGTMIIICVGKCSNLSFPQAMKQAHQP